MGLFKRKKKIKLDLHIDKQGNVIECKSDSNSDVEVNLHLDGVETDWRIVGGNKIIRTFKIPVGNLSNWFFSIASKYLIPILNF